MPPLATEAASATDELSRLYPPRPVGRVALSVDGVTKRYGNLVANAEISLTLRTGEIVGLLGPNGAGKTTLVRQIVGLLEPNEGTIHIFGRRLGPSDVRRHVGFMVEGKPSLFEFMSGRQNLHYFGLLAGLHASVVRQRSEFLLRKLELDAVASLAAQFYSWGMKRRLGLAIALLKQASIIVLDEPHASLDLASVLGLRSFLVELRQRGAAVLITSHDLSFVEGVCDRVYILDRGAVVAHGSLPELEQQFALERTVRIALRLPPSEPRDALAEWVTGEAGDGLVVTVPLARVTDVLMRYKGCIVAIGPEEPMLSQVFRKATRHDSR